MIELASHHAIPVIAILIALVTALGVFVFSERWRHTTRAVEHLDSAIRLAESRSYRAAGVKDPLTFWRDEIRGIAERYGSPVKAAIQLERSMNALDLRALDDRQLEALHEYWLEVSNWFGRVRVELNKLDPEREWNPAAWTRLFNVFGRINLLVVIA